MADEVTVLGDRFAPVTSAMGFLRAPLDVVADGLAAWRRELHGSSRVERLAGGLVDNVLRLEPLTGGVVPRELVVATANPEWTAVVDCAVLGGDQISRTGYLARRLQIQGVGVVSIPDRPAAVGRPPRYGARQFQIFAPIETEFLNHVREVSLVRDGTRWRFDAVGTVQDFEDVSAYQRRRVSERFTGQMLVDYSAALGLRPFDDDFFPGPSVLVHSPVVPPSGALVLSVAETQKWTGMR